MDNQTELLVERAGLLIKKMEERDTLYARILQQKQKAEITEDSLLKIKEAAENAQCLLPDTSELKRDITDGVISGINTNLAEGIRSAIRNEYVPHQSVKKEKRKVFILVTVSFVLAILLAVAMFWYHSSEHYWGDQYMKIIESKYTTESERDVLWNNVYAVGALPKEYETDPDYVKAKIKQNKAVLKERKQQAKDKKGKWSTIVPIER